MGQKHFTKTHQEIIARLLTHGTSLRNISKIIGYSPAAVSKEIKRNCNYKHIYAPDTAQYKMSARKLHYRKTRKQTEFLVKYIQEKLELFWSPEQISGRLKLEYPNQPELHISHKTIYRWLKTGSYAAKPTIFTGYAKKLRLKRPGKKWGGSKAAIPHGTIELPDIGSRGETTGFGHWEGDLIHGHNKSGYILTLVDRSSGFLLACPVRKKESAQVTSCICRLLGVLPAHYRRTATYDRGKEFYGFSEVYSALGLPSYFCHASSPHERALNEQTNGLLRQFFPKHMNFSDLESETVNRAVSLINNRPRKKFGFKTTIEVLQEKGLDDVLTLG